MSSDQQNAQVLSDASAPPPPPSSSSVPAAPVVLKVEPILKKPKPVHKRRFDFDVNQAIIEAPRSERERRPPLRISQGNLEYKEAPPASSSSASASASASASLFSSSSSSFQASYGAIPNQFSNNAASVKKAKGVPGGALTKAQSKSGGGGGGGGGGISNIVSYMQAEQPKSAKPTWVPPSVALSERDRAPQLRLSKDQMEFCGVYGGYRVARATHGVHNGAYYWEAEILPPAVAVAAVADSTGAAGVEAAAAAAACHCRIGWSTRQGDLQSPVGTDAYGYGYRDISGSKVHNGVRDDAYGEPYGPGDIIGCFLYLDVENVSNNQMRFFKNGHDQGVAYRGYEIPLGVYFPACSVYMQASIRVNFGPSFILKHDIFGANAVSEVQPMNPEDRRAHDVRIAAIRASNKACKALRAELDRGVHRGVTLL